MKPKTVPTVSMKRRKRKFTPQSKSRPVYIRVGAVVNRDGSLQLLLDPRVASLAIAGPFPVSSSMAEKDDRFPPDDVPF